MEGCSITLIYFKYIGGLGEYPQLKIKVIRTLFVKAVVEQVAQESLARKTLASNRKIGRYGPEKIREEMKVKINEQ